MSRKLKNRNSAGLITIYARSALSGEKLASVQLFTTDTVQSLRCMVARRMRRNPMILRMLLDGKVLADDELLDAAGFSPGNSTVDIFWCVPTNVGAFRCANDTIDIRDVKTGEHIIKLAGHEGEVNLTEFSRDGRFLVSASDDGTAKTWSIEDGRCIATLCGNQGNTQVAAFSPDGSLVVTGSDVSGIAKVWETSTGDEKVTLKGLTDDSIFAATFSQSGSLIAIGYWSGVAKIWEAATGNCVLTLKGNNQIKEEEHGQCNNGAHAVNCVAFSPDGQLVVTGNADSTGVIWRLKNGAAAWILRGHVREILSVAFSPDSSCVVTGAEDYTVKLWDARSGRCTMAIKGLTDYFSHTFFSYNGDHVVTTSTAGVVNVWDKGTGECVVEWANEQSLMSVYMPDVMTTVMSRP